MRPLKLLLTSLLLLFLSPLPVFADTAHIAAAADLQYALKELAGRFEAHTGHKLTLSFGSSGQFVTQIEQGAPFELFLSADESYVKQLSEHSLTLDQGQLYAIGRLALFAPAHSPLKPEQGLAGLGSALKVGTLHRFAIANPAHAPYGRAAREALTKAGLWTRLQPKLVLGENASQAAQFALSGSTEGGLLPYALVLAPAFKSGSYALIPANQHQPLRQRMVLLKKAGPVAKAFYAYLQQAEARQILSHAGFTLPGK